MKYIIGELVAPDTKYYDDLKEFNAEFGIALESGSWCYNWQLSYVQDLPKDAEVSWYLGEVAKYLYDHKAIVTFSVTSNEDRYQEWLDALAGVPGATVTSTTRKAYGKTKYYTVFLCSFPVSPTFEEI